MFLSNCAFIILLLHSKCSLFSILMLLLNKCEYLAVTELLFSTRSLGKISVSTSAVFITFSSLSQVSMNSNFDALCSFSLSSASSVFSSSYFVSSLHSSIGSSFSLSADAFAIIKLLDASDTLRKIFKVPLKLFRCMSVSGSSCSLSEMPF